MPSKPLCLVWCLGNMRGDRTGERAETEIWMVSG